jgi:2-deoxy-D-gluconate 3-dehydrogenase
MKGKQILITGATNGIGLAAAEALAQLGANVAIVGRNETRTKIAAHTSERRRMKQPSTRSSPTCPRGRRYTSWQTQFSPATRSSTCS